MVDLTQQMLNFFAQPNTDGSQGNYDNPLYCSGTFAFGVANVSTVSTTPAAGSCAAQFQLVQPLPQSLNVSKISYVKFYLSDVNGNLASSAATSIVENTNGVLHQVVTGLIVEGTTNATGQVGITLTASAGTYYVTFLLPGGNLITSGALVVNA